MKIKPIQDRILIKPLNPETMTKTGIVIPDSVAEKSSQGKVIAAGPGKITDDGKFISLSVKEGDSVLYNKFTGQTVKVDNEEFVVLKEDEIIAIVE